MLKNHLWRVVGAICALVVVSLVLVNSCGSDDGYDNWGGMSKEEWQAEKKKRNQQEKTENKSAEKKTEKPASPSRKSPPHKPPRPKKQPKPAVQEPQTPKRPDDFADWKLDDYYSAYRESDRQLAKAINHLGKFGPDKRVAAEILKNMLAVPASSSNDTSKRNAKAVGDAKIIEAVIVALADNGTPAAWKTIEQVALGKLAVKAPEAAVLEAVKMLIEHPSLESEEALLCVVASASQPFSNGYGQEKAVERKDQILSSVKSSASRQFRIRLADHIVSSQPSLQVFDRLWSCLQNQSAEDLIPQVVVYQSNHLSKTAREKMEKWLLPESNAALWRLFGVRPEPVKRKKKPKNATPTDYMALAERLWSPGFATAVKRRVLAVDTLEKSKESISLASTLPRGSIRTVLHRTLKLHWEEKPTALKKNGLGKEVIPEPGFLVVLKYLPRKDPPSDDSIHASKRSSKSRSSSPKTAALLDARHKRDEIAYEWMAFSEELTRKMCQHFFTAAVARGDTGLITADDVDSDRFPLKPHPGAEIVAIYTSSWPDDIKNASTQLAALPPLRVHYLRIEQRAKPKRVLGYYRRQLHGHEEHKIKQGVWLDSLASSSDKPLDQSIDVLITTPGTDNPGLVNSEQRLVVEILSVECKPITSE